MGWKGAWEGVAFRIEGTHVYLRSVHDGVWQKPLEYCKAIILQLKINRISKRLHINAIYMFNIQI